MKVIEIKKYPLGQHADGKVIESSTIDLFNAIIDNSKADNITTSDQRRRMKLLDSFEAGIKDGKLELENADFDFLKELIEGMMWKISTSGIRQFIKDIDGVQ